MDRSSVLIGHGSELTVGIRSVAWVVLGGLSCLGSRPGALTQATQATVTQATQATQLPRRPSYPGDPASVDAINPGGMPRTCIVQLTPVILTLLCFACGGDGGPVSPGSGTGFEGRWDGTWQRTSCTDTVQGIACSQTPMSGGLRVTLAQSGTEAQGTMEFGPFVVPVTGTVTSGTLSLSGQARAQATTGRITAWSTTRSGNTMSGSFTFSIVADNPADGSSTVTVSLQNVTRTA